MLHSDIPVDSLSFWGRESNMLWLVFVFVLFCFLYSNSLPHTKPLIHQMNYKLATNNTIQNTKQLHKCELHQWWSRKMRWSEKHELKPLMLDEVRTQKALQSAETGKLPTCTYRGQGRAPVTNIPCCNGSVNIQPELNWLNSLTLVLVGFASFLWSFLIFFFLIF